MSRRFISLFVLLSFIGCKSASRSQDSISVFVAASLVDVADSLSQIFQAENPGKRIRFNVGASSTLARQIEFGASADYFLSADSLWSDYVVAKIPTATASRVPATNTLVIFSMTRDLDSVDELRSTVRLALADPSHVPAGRYSRAALQCLGLWDELVSRIIPTADVRAALAAATTGSVDASIVYATDAAVVHQAGKHVLPIPMECQPSISIDLVSLPGSRKESWRQGFGDLMLSTQNRGTWESFGFVPTGGTQ